MIIDNFMILSPNKMTYLYSLFLLISYNLVL